MKRLEGKGVQLVQLEKEHHPHLFPYCEETQEEWDCWVQQDHWVELRGRLD